MVSKHFFCSVFLVCLMAFSCSTNTSDKHETSNLETEIENALEIKYEEPFKVTDHYFEKGLNGYVFTAHPTKNDQISFEGNYDERKTDPGKRITSDAYTNMKYSFDANAFFNSLFSRNAPKHVTASSVYSMREGISGKVPDWETYLNYRDEGSTVRMNTYFFEVPGSADHKTIALIKTLLEGLQVKYGNDYSLYVGFWPEGFLEDKNLEKLTFGFEATTQDDADHLLNKTQYLAREFFVKVVNGSVTELTEKEIFELSKPYNKTGPTEMVEI